MRGWLLACPLITVNPSRQDARKQEVATDHGHGPHDCGSAALRRQWGGHRMIRGIFVAAAFAVGLSSVAALAQNNIIAERQQLMKGLGQAGRAPGAMLKGDQAFDLAAVQVSLKTFAESAKKAPSLFPAGTETGNDTAALPKVWTDKADFDAKWAKFAADSEAAQVAIKDEASFKSTFPNVVRACGGCHEGYRAKKN